MGRKEFLGSATIRLVFVVGNIQFPIYSKHVSMVDQLIFFKNFNPLIDCRNKLIVENGSSTH